MADGLRGLPQDEHRFLHSPKRPDMLLWPWSTPWIMAELQKHELDVVPAGTVDAMERVLADTLERCRTAEKRGYDACVAQVREMAGLKS